MSQEHRCTMKKELNFLQKISIYLIINIHQKKVSPYLIKKGHRCRFYPTCSEYALIAIKKHGFFKGWTKAIWRVLRCNPSNMNSCVDYP